MEFTLRPWRLSDLDSLVRYGNNPAVAMNMTDGFPSPYTPERGKVFLEMMTTIVPERIWAIDVNGEACGGIGIHPMTDIMRRNAELGYWLGEPFWNKGIISRAIPIATSRAFNNLPEIERIFARPFGRNIASQKALEKAGYVYETRFDKTIYKNGVFEDELFYAVRRK